MARGLILPSYNRSTSNLLLNSISRVSLSPSKCHINPFVPNQLRPWRRPIPSHFFFFCNCSSHQDSDVTSEYKEAFSRRMSLAGLKPHHRIALGVSGGPDSMALCVLAAGWKKDGLNTSRESNDFIDGILAIIVDHGLRSESKDEAHLVSQRVSDMGIRCEIARCDWLDGKPKQGHIQEAAREMRYQIFQKVCVQQMIDVLLIAHHADDQAELFIIRLSRNSGVLGLAGMAFTSQLFSYTHHLNEAFNNRGVLVVRPLLEFSKEDMYKICIRSKREWVEDPTNQSQVFARNRIRLALNDNSSCEFKSELQAVISSCRKTRSYVEQVCCDLIKKAVMIMAHGYAIIDLEILNPSKIEDISLSKFISLVLQFISQKNRPVRGSTSKLLLDYIRTFPCKTSLTAAGCYLCPDPGSKGTKLLVCCSVTTPPPSTMGLIYKDSSFFEQNPSTNNDLEQILTHGKSNLEKLIQDGSELHFFNTTSENILSEAQKLNIISESTFQNILLLQREETEHFKSKKGSKLDYESKHEVKNENTSLSEALKPGQVCYFMKRFLVSWDLTPEPNCGSCVVVRDMAVQVRHMVDADWLYLADLVKSQGSEKSQRKSVLIGEKTEQVTKSKILCSNYVNLSAQRALLLLISIPVAARRALPVIVNRQGLLLSIPSVDFKQCPCLKASAVFKPTAPLGGGHTSFI